MSDAPSDSKPQNRLKTTGHAVFGFTGALALAQFPLADSSQDVPSPGAGEEDGAHAVQRRLRNGLVKTHNTGPSAELYSPPLRRDGQTVTVWFTDLVDEYLGDAEIELHADEDEILCRLHNGRAAATSHYARVERRWVVDYLYLPEPAALSLAVRRGGATYTIPFPSVAKLARLEQILALFTDESLSALALQTESEDIDAAGKGVTDDDGLSDDEKTELAAIVENARRLLAARRAARVRDLETRIRALWQEPGTAGAEAPLKPDTGQVNLDELGDELQNSFTWYADAAALASQLSAAQERLIKETVVSSAVSQDNHVTISFSNAPGRDFREYDYYLLLNDEAQSELLAGEYTLNSRLNGLQWVIKPHAAKPGDTWRLEGSVAGNDNHKYVLHASGTEDFFESAETRQGLEKNVDALFADGADGRDATLEVSVTMSDISTLREALGKMVFAEGDTFPGLLEERLSRAESLLEEQQSDLTRRISALFADSAKEILSVEARQEEADSLDDILDRKNSAGAPWPGMKADLRKAQLLLLEDTIDTVTVDGPNSITVTFSARDGRDFRLYEYHLMLNNVRTAVLSKGKAAAPGTLSGRNWTVPTPATTGPKSACKIEVQRGPGKYILRLSGMPAFYTAVADQNNLEVKLKALFKDAGQKTLAGETTLAKIDELETALAAMTLSDAQRIKLTALTDKARLLWLKSTITRAQPDVLNQVVVTFSEDGWQNKSQYHYCLIVDDRDRSEIREGRPYRSVLDEATRTWTSGTEAGPDSTFRIEVRRRTGNAQRTDILLSPGVGGFHTPVAQQKKVLDAIAEMSSLGTLADNVTQENLNDLRTELSGMKLSAERRTEIKKKVDEVQMLMLKAAITFSVSGNKVTVTFARDDARGFRSYYCEAWLNKTRQSFRYSATSEPKVFTVGPADSFKFSVHFDSTVYVLFALPTLPDATVYPL
ncbi:TPA: hypothetical protein QH957_001552 [Enterobacter bugandensis]|nr:hypothetical protein [Enterobacter bugandensis]